MEFSSQPIIPGLPDDLALICLAKISHGYHACLETVSKRWRDVLRCAKYSSYKAKQGWCGDWVFVLTRNDEDQWIAYDPDSDRWHPMPKIPGRDDYACSEGFRCVCVGNRFLVIGGFYRRTGDIPFITNQVFQFDTYTKEWSEAANMRTPRAQFGCCVMSGKVYVCGGREMPHSDGIALVEVYDPLTNKWEEVAPMQSKQVNCFSLSHDGNLYVFADGRSNRRSHPFGSLCEYKTEIFDPSRQVWRTEQMNWPCLAFGRAEVQVTEDGGLYGDVRLDGVENHNVVKRMDNGGEWHVVAQLPDMGLGVVVQNGFIALGNELYVIRRMMSCPMGGSRLLCWIWDGKWRETRPLFRPWSGGVTGIAALKEKKNMSTTTCQNSLGG